MCHHASGQSYRSNERALAAAGTWALQVQLRWATVEPDSTPLAAVRPRHDRWRASERGAPGAWRPEEAMDDAKSSQSCQKRQSRRLRMHDTPGTRGQRWLHASVCETSGSARPPDRQSSSRGLGRKGVQHKVIVKVRLGCRSAGGAEDRDGDAVGSSKEPWEFFGRHALQPSLPRNPSHLGLGAAAPPRIHSLKVYFE